MDKMVRTVVSQEMDNEMRNSAAWDDCRTLIEVLQKDVLRQAQDHAVHASDTW